MDFDVSGALGKIYVDAPKLEQILINLLNNAIKFTQDDGEISVSLEPASLEALSDDLRILPWSELAELKFVRVAVKDTGIGMTEQQMEVVKQFGFLSNPSMKWAMLLWAVFALAYLFWIRRFFVNAPAQQSVEITDNLV